MKNILVPTDFSENALNALKKAAQIARKSNAAIHLVHVYEKPMYGITLQFGVDNKENHVMQEAIKSELSRLSKESFLKGVPTHIYMKPDIEIWELINEDEFKDIYMIIMGLKGTGTTAGSFMGSNTDKIIRHSKCPVLVVKGKNDNFNPAHMVFACDFSVDTESSFKKIAKFSELYNSKIHLLHVITPTNFEPTWLSEKNMHDFARIVGIKNYTVNTYNEKTIEEGVHYFSLKIQANLIAMETHGRTGLSQFFYGSITEDVINSSSIPILSVRIGDS